MTHIIREDTEWLVSHTDWKRFVEKKILITGASGAIARYLVYYFMFLNEKYKADCAVYALVRNEEKARRLFGAYLQNTNFHLIVGSVEENEDYASGMNYIFHAAGISTTALFSKKPVEVLKANLIGTYFMLDKLAGQEKGVLEKFVFFSSGAVYGRIPDSVMETPEDTYYEINALSDNGVYAEGKKTGELLCYAYGKEHRIPTVMARIGHSYGPGSDIMDGHIYSDLMKAVVERTPIAIRNPEIERPFTYVRDTVFGILLMALYGEDGNAYNVWNADEKISVGRLAHLLAKEIFSDRNLSVYCNGELYEYMETKENADIRRLADTRKLEALGWKASVGVGEGFFRAVQSLEEEGRAHYRKEQM